jgi:tRNA(Arg) A34 adenosine deaminase TadA
MKAVNGHSACRDLRSLEDAQRLRVLADFTTSSQMKGHLTPFAAELTDSKTGRRIIRQLSVAEIGHDPSKHAELLAIRGACKKKKSRSLQGCTLYTICEPCPMCMGLILWSRVDRIVYGATLDDAGQFGAQIYTYARQMVKSSDFRCEISGPLERERCLELFRLPVRRQKD